MDAPTVMDPSVYYYSYSTLAQSLAGAFGFLAAVVVYRLQALNTQMERTIAGFMGDPHTFNMEPFRTLFAYQRWALFVQHVKRDQDSSNRNPIFKNLNFIDLGAMNHTNDQILSIRRWFLIAMIMTVTAISLCLLALFLMAWLQNPIILGSLVFLGFLSLASYMRLMLLVLQ